MVDWDGGGEELLYCCGRWSAFASLLSLRFVLLGCSYAPSTIPKPLRNIGITDIRSGRTFSVVYS